MTLSLSSPGFNSIRGEIQSKLRNEITRRRGRDTVPSSRRSLIKLSPSFNSGDYQAKPASQPRSGAHVAQSTVKT